MAFSLFFVVGLLVYLLFFAGFYILCNFGLWRMASHAGVPHAWLAWVPFGSAYAAGMLAERSVYTFTGRRSRLALWCPALQGIAFMGVLMVLGFAILDMDFGAPVVLALLLCILGTLAAAVVYFYALYYIFKDYAPENAVLYTLLGILFGIYWIFQLVEMNTVPVSVTGFGAWPGGRPKYNRSHQWNAGYPGYPGYPGQPGGYAAGSAPQQGCYTTNPGQQQGPPQQPYQGQGPQFYQPQGGYYQPPEHPRDEGENNGPELK